MATGNKIRGVRMDGVCRLLAENFMTNRGTIAVYTVEHGMRGGRTVGHPQMCAPDFDRQSPKGPEK